MRTPALAIVAVLATVTHVGAQPAARAPACDTCARGEELVAQLSLQPLRTLAGTLAALAPREPLTTEQYARVLELRRRTPALVRLGAVDDLDLAAIAAALCETTAGACLAATTRALRCLADRCEVAVPPSDPEHADVLEYPECRRSRSRTARTAPLGLGLEWGTGWHGSRYPADGRAWSLGIEARLRLARRVSAVARIDRVAGRDEAIDLDGDDHDDAWTGSITRIYALAGPSIVLDHARFEGETRFLSLDLLAGYVSTRSQAAESGFGAGFDLSYQLSVARIGMRFVQGFGDASAATMVLGHLGFTAGGRPSLRREREGDCASDRDPRDAPSRLAIGFDFPVLGYGLSSELGLLASGLGVEIAWNLTRRLDILARGDLLIYPGYERDRTIHQAVLAGPRIDHGGRRRRSETGYFTTVMGGYSHGAGLTPTTTGSGPIGEVSTGWGLQSGNGAVYLRLHARFGLGPDNLDYRAVFLSSDFELRFDGDRWSR